MTDFSFLFKKNRLVERNETVKYIIYLISFLYKISNVISSHRICTQDD
ncbi:hypothetical protein SAMN05444371_0857 [Epilithonimonas mollis]|uniref:Uncharacterized protein n=1 Tax=Epilithonimonas mollis TaxID=216903 RepID=A0A1M6P4D1_9FLAO|nr:hypothetical protein SAMN05444371_0857 [Epilithonimonas mollis]